MAAMAVLTPDDREMAASDAARPGSDKARQDHDLNGSRPCRARAGKELQLYEYALAVSRSTSLRTLPEAVLGRLSTSCTYSGVFCRARPAS